MKKSIRSRGLSAITAFTVLFTAIFGNSFGIFTVDAVEDTSFSGNSKILDITVGSITINADGYTQGSTSESYSGFYTIQGNGGNTANKININGYNGIITVKDVTLIPNGNNQHAITVENGSDTTILLDNVIFENVPSNSYLWGLIKSYYDSFRGLKVVGSRVIVAKAFDDFASPSIDTNFKLDTKVNIQGNSYAYVYGDIEKLSYFKGSKLYVYGEIKSFSTLFDVDKSNVFTKDGMSWEKYSKVDGFYLPTNIVNVVEKTYDGDNSVDITGDYYSNFSISFKTGIWPFKKSHSFNSSNINRASGYLSSANAGYASAVISNKSSAFILNNNDFKNDRIFMPPIIIAKINPAATTTVITQPAAVNFGDTVNLTASVTMPATGTVEFFMFNTETEEYDIILNTAEVVSGVATATAVGLNAGTHSVKAIFTSANENFTGSFSAPVDVVVNKATPSLVLNANPSSTYVGGTIALTAELTFNGAPLDGEVILSDGVSSKVSDGVFTAEISSDDAETKLITATFAGNDNFEAVETEISVEFSEKEAVTITVDDIVGAVYGEEIEFKATVIGNVVNTPVTFDANELEFDDLSTDDGEDTDFDDVNDGEDTDFDDVNDGDEFGAQAFEQGEFGDLTDFFVPAVSAPTGTVTFKLGTTILGTSDLDSNGEATLNITDTSVLTAGGKTITAEYSGDAIYALSSASKAFNIAKKELTVSGLTAQDKTYSETDLSVTLNSSTLDKTVDGDDVSLNGELAGTVAADYVPGDNVPVVISSINLVGDDKDNYELTLPDDLTVKVIKAEFDLSLLNVIPDGKDYDGTDAVSGYSIATAGAIPGKISSYLTTDSPFDIILSFNGVNAGTTSVAIDSYTVPAELSTYYSFTGNFSTDTAVISKLEIGPEYDAEDKDYDGTADAVINVYLSSTVDGENPTATATGVFSDKNSDVDKIVYITSVQLDPQWEENYILSYSQIDPQSLPEDAPDTVIGTATASIFKLKLTPQFNVASKTFNGNTNANITVAFDGAISGEIPTGTATGYFETASVGTGKKIIIDTVVLGEDWEVNYYIGEYENPTGSITSAGSVVTPPSPPSPPSSSSPTAQIEDPDVPLALPESSNSADNVIDIEDKGLPLSGNPGMGQAAVGGLLILLLGSASTAYSCHKRKKK